MKLSGGSWKLALSAGLALGVASALYVTNKEYSRSVVVHNRDGRSRAVLIFQPGISGFPDRIAQSFAEGLAESGWRVEVMTATSLAPADLSSFQLVVFLSPVYWWSPSPPMRRYFRRVSPLRNKPTVVLLTASGSSDRAMQQMTEEVRRIDGKIVTALSLYRWRPNDDAVTTSPNEEVAARIARRSAKEIKPEL